MIFLFTGYDLSDLLIRYEKSRRVNRNKDASLFGIFMVDVMFFSLEIGRSLSYVTKKTRK